MLFYCDYSVFPVSGGVCGRLLTYVCVTFVILQFRRLSTKGRLPNYVVVGYIVDEFLLVRTSNRCRAMCDDCLEDKREDQNC